MTYRTDAAPPQPDRSILVVALDGRVHGLERESGRIVWQNGLSGGGYGPVFIAVGYGVVIASANGNRVFCLDYLTGEIRWERTTQSAGRATILIEPDCVVCVKRGYVDCFGIDGAVRWQEGLQGAGVGHAALGFPGNVAQADETHH